MRSCARAGGGIGLVIALAVNTGCLRPHASTNWHPLQPSRLAQVGLVGSAASPRHPPTPFAADKSPPLVTDNRADGEIVSRPSVVQAGYEQPGPGGVPPAVTVPPVPSTGSTPLPMPSQHGVTALPVPTDPHARTSPTLFGERLNLRPGELPMDRALELSKRLEQCVTDNQVLMARINTLMADAQARENAIREGLRDVDSATGEVSRTRGELAEVRRELDALRERMKRMEYEEVENLKKIIEAIEKLIQKQDEIP